MGTDMRAYFGEVSNFVEDVRRRASGIKVTPPSTSPLLPQQVEMPCIRPKRKDNDTERSPLASGSDDLDFDFDFADVVEVPAGPTDGRYQSARQGAMHAAANGGRDNAR